MRRTDGDFYVGYEAQAPPGLARFLRRVSALGLILAAVLGGALALLHRPFEPGVFEFGLRRSFEGTVQSSPYPLLLVERPGRAGDAAPHSRYLLVAPGKRGADELVAAVEGEAVELDGTLVYRDDHTMVEMAGAPTATGRPAAGTTGAEDLGTRTLVGEIVDSKCFYGVMRPGRGKVHRSCAVRCISGGIPPVFAVERRDGGLDYLLLTDAAGGAVHRDVLDMVAEPLEITGRVLRDGDLLRLQADPGTYRRLD